MSDRFCNCHGISDPNSPTTELLLSHPVLCQCNRVLVVCVMDFVFLVVSKETERILQETRLVLLVCWRALNPSFSFTGSIFFLLYLGLCSGGTSWVLYGLWQAFRVCRSIRFKIFLYSIFWAFPGVKRERVVNVRIAPPSAGEDRQGQVRRTIRYGGWAGRHNALLDTCTRSSHALTQAVWKSEKND